MATEERLSPKPPQGVEYGVGDAYRRRASAVQWRVMLDEDGVVIPEGSRSVLDSSGSRSTESNGGRL